MDHFYAGNREDSKKVKYAKLTFWLAEGQGFEPWLTGPEPVVLPLDDPSINASFLYENALNRQVKTETKHTDMSC